MLNKEYLQVVKELSVEEESKEAQFNSSNKKKDDILDDSEVDNKSYLS